MIAKQNYIVLEARFAPKYLAIVKAIKEKMDELTFLRESKQPLEYPSCGSVFKRPPGYFAGKLIQDSGLQGVQLVEHRYLQSMLGSLLILAMLLLLTIWH